LEKSAAEGLGRVLEMPHGDSEGGLPIMFSSKMKKTAAVVALLFIIASAGVAVRRSTPENAPVPAAKESGSAARPQPMEPAQAGAKQNPAAAEANENQAAVPEAAEKIVVENTRDEGKAAAHAQPDERRTIEDARAGAFAGRQGSVSEFEALKKDLADLNKKIGDPKFTKGAAEKLEQIRQRENFTVKDAEQLKREVEQLRRTLNKRAPAPAKEKTPPESSPSNSKVVCQAGSTLASGSGDACSFTAPPLRKRKGNR